MNLEPEWIVATAAISTLLGSGGTFVYMRAFREASVDARSKTAGVTAKLALDKVEALSGFAAMAKESERESATAIGKAELINLRLHEHQLESAARFSTLEERVNEQTRNLMQAEARWTKSVEALDTTVRNMESKIAGMIENMARRIDAFFQDDRHRKS